MRYRAAFKIEAGATEADPALQEMDLEPGNITEVEMLFPAGHAGLTYVQIYYQTRQIFPLSPGEAFRGDDHVLQFPEAFPIAEVPFMVELRGWAPDATLDHTVYVGITVMPFPERDVSGVALPGLPEGM